MHVGLVDYDVTLRDFQILSHAHRLDDGGQIWWSRTYEWRRRRVRLEQWHGNYDASVRSTTGEVVFLTILQFWALRIRLQWFRFRHGRSTKVPGLPKARTHK